MMENIYGNYNFSLSWKNAESEKLKKFDNFEIRLKLEDLKKLDELGNSDFLQFLTLSIFLVNFFSFY